MLSKRLTHYVISAQPAEQAAYRKGFSTEDHLISVTLAIEKAKECNDPLWIALVDFEKAFDLVERRPLWEALCKQGVPKEYIILLKRLYEDQTAQVQAGNRSRSFSLKRGVKQGDPLSSLLAIAVMQACFEELHYKWDRLNSRRRGK